MLEILTLATALFGATPAQAADTTTAAPATTAAAPVTTATTAATTTTTAAAPAQQQSIWQSLGNTVIAHDTIVSMDTNGDGTVSHDEYMAYQEAQFKALDKNSDGSLSSDEVGSSKKKSFSSFW